MDTDGVYLCPVRLDDGSWRVDVETTVVSIAKDAEQIELVTDIIDREGNVVASCGGSVTVTSHNKATSKYFTTVNNPTLWDIDATYLYTVKTRVICNGEVCDE